MKNILARLLICLMTFPALPSYFTRVDVWDGIDEIDINSDGSLNVKTTAADTVTARVSLRDTVHVVITDHEQNMAGIDAATNTLQTIELEHHEIHKGEHFACPDTALDCDAGNSKYWFIKTPNTATRCHFTFEVSTSKNGAIFFWGASDTGATGSKGTALQRYNNDRNNTADTAFTQIFKNPTFSGAGATLGNMMYAQVVGTDGSNPTGDQGGQANRNHEMILKQNTHYTVEFRAQTNDTRLSFIAHFYEE